MSKYIDFKGLFAVVDGQTTKGDRIYEAVMWYIDNGFPILPADHEGKLPKKSFGSYNYNNPITDKALAEELFGAGGKFYGWNISLPTGPKSGFGVVDIDNKNGKDGSSAFAELVGTYGELDDETIYATTPSGGVHVFLEYRKGFNSTNPNDLKSNGLLPGIDTRGGRRDKDVNGGHVLIYPSSKANPEGKEVEYRWSNYDGKVSTCPDWIIDLIAGARPVVADPKMEMPDVIPAGGRDTFLYNFGLRLVARGYNDDDVEMHMRRAGEKFDPPDPAMVEAKIRQVLSSTVHEKMELLNELGGKVARSEKTGQILPTVENFYQLMQSNIMRAQIRLGHDLFKERVMNLDDTDMNLDEVYNKVERILSREFQLEKMRSVVTNHTVPATQELFKFDSLQEYFDNLRWDGVDRISEMVGKLGIAPGSLQEVYLRKWLIGGAARCYMPGAKVDCILVLIGEQGVRKSTFFKMLTPGEHPDHVSRYISETKQQHWFTDSVGKDKRLSHPDEVRKLKGKFIGEMAEMHAMSRNEITEIKHFLSESAGEYVQKYKEDVSKIPRRFILGGTSNRQDYLGDDTGNRRFWNIYVGKHIIDTDWVYHNRDQIWAQVAHLFREKEVWWLSDQEFKNQQEDNRNYEIQDAWAEPLLNWCNDKSRFSKADALVYGVGVELGRISQQDQIRVNRILAQAGWKSKRIRWYDQNPNVKDTSGSISTLMMNPDKTVDRKFDKKKWTEGIEY